MENVRKYQSVWPGRTGFSTPDSALSGVVLDLDGSLSLAADGSAGGLNGAGDLELNGQTRVMEVAQHMSERVVRCIMLAGSEGLARGMKVTAPGKTIEVPVGEQTLGRMFNVLGQLMGIPSLKYTSSYMSQASIDNIGMCIPINVAKPLIREALEKYDGESVSKYLEDKAKEADINTTGDDVDSKPRLGVSVQTLDSTNNAVARQILPKGCLVTKVEDNSAAAAAGIQAGDIIVDVDGTVITSSEGLQEIIFSHAEGDTVQVKVYRAENVLDAKYISDIGDGEYIDMSVTLKVVASPAA